MSEHELPDLKELEEIKEKAFTRRVALITAFFAVILSVTSLGGNHAMKEMLLAQQQASDQWAFYQAKSIREHLYGSQKMMLDSEVKLLGGTLPPDAADRIRSTLDSLGKEEARYNQDKKQIEHEARKLEAERDVARSRDPYFELGEVFLHIAIVMATVAIIAGSRGVFYFAVAAACAGTLLAANGYFLIFSVPFMG